MQGGEVYSVSWDLNRQSLDKKSSAFTGPVLYHLATHHPWGCQNLSPLQVFLVWGVGEGWGVGWAGGGGGGQMPVLCIPSFLTTGAAMLKATMHACMVHTITIWSNSQEHLTEVQHINYYAWKYRAITMYFHNASPQSLFTGSGRPDSFAVHNNQHTCSLVFPHKKSCLYMHVHFLTYTHTPSSLCGDT